MEQARLSVSATEQNNSPGELQLLRLVICGMRAAARAASAGRARARWSRPLEAAACRVVARQARRDHLLVHGLWCNLRASSLRKLRAHLARGDAPAAGYRLTALDWAVVDLLLLYDTPLLSVASFHQRAQLAALERTFEVVQQLQLEPEDGQDVPPERWSTAASLYCRDGVQMSAVALQRRWHELKLDARRRACAPAGPRPLLLPIHEVVATRYPHVVNSSELPTWHQMVAAGKVAEPTSERGPAPGLHNDSANLSIETIDLSEDEDDRTPHNETQQIVSKAILNDVSKEELVGSNNSKKEIPDYRRSINNRDKSSRENETDTDTVEVTEIIEIEDDSPSPDSDVVESIEDIDLSHTDATIVYESVKEDVKAIFVDQIANVDKDSEVTTVEHYNSENDIKPDIFSDSNSKVKNESNLNDDIKVEIQEKYPLKVEESSEMEEKYHNCKSPDLNIQIENKRTLTDSEFLNITSETGSNAILGNNLTKIAETDEDKINIKYEVTGDLNTDNSFDQSEYTTIEYSENHELKDDVKIEPIDIVEIDLKPITDVQSDIAHKNNENDNNSKKNAEYFFDTKLIESKIEKQINDHIDPKLFMWPMIILRRIDEELQICLDKPPITGKSGKSRSRQKCKSSYSRMSHERNKALLRRCTPCRVLLRRVDEDWGGDVGGEIGRKRVQLPDMDKVRWLNQRIQTAEVAPLASVQSITNKRFRPNTPDNLLSVYSFDPLEPFESSYLQGTLCSHVPPLWAQNLPMATFPSTSRRSDNINFSAIDPALQQNYVSIPPYLNMMRSHGVLLQDAQNPRPNLNAPMQGFIFNPILQQNNESQSGLPQNITSYNLGQRSDTENVFTHTSMRSPQTQEVATANISTQNTTGGNIVARTIAAQNLLQQNIAIPNITVKKIGTQNMATQKIARQNIAAQNILTQNIAAQNLLTQNLAAERPLVNVSGIPFAQTGLTNIQPNITINGGLISQEIPGIFLKQGPNPLNQILPRDQFMPSQTNPFLVDSFANPMLVNPQAMLLNNIGNQAYSPLQLSPMQTVQSSGVIGRSSLVPTVEDGCTSVTTDGSKTNETSIDSNSSKHNLPVDLDQAVPIENVFNLIPCNDNSLKPTVLNESLDILDWNSCPLSSATLVRNPSKFDSQRVLCTGPGQGWRLKGHLLVSEQERPPGLAAIWSIKPRFRLRLPVPSEEPRYLKMAQNLVFKGRVYQRLGNKRFRYALMLVAVESAAACRRLLARAAALQLYCLQTGTLYPIRARRLENGSYIFFGHGDIEEPLVELSCQLYGDAPRAPTPTPTPEPSAPTPMRHTAALRPRSGQSPEPASDTVLTRSTLSDLISAEWRPPAPMSIASKPSTDTPIPSAPTAPIPSAPTTKRSSSPKTAEKPSTRNSSASEPSAPKPWKLRKRAPTVSVTALKRSMAIPSKPQSFLKTGRRASRAARLRDASSCPTERSRHKPTDFDTMSEADFVAKYRLPKDRVLELAEELGPAIKHFVITKLLWCLSYLGTATKRPLGTGLHVIDALNLTTILHKYVSFPHEPEQRRRVTHRFKELHKLPHVVGVVDGVQFPLIDIPDRDGSYLNRAGFHSLNVQLICDADLNILSVDTSQGGGVRDRTIWGTHPLNAALSSLHGAGETVWLLGDSGFLQRETLMTPFPPTTDPAELHYNTLHSHAWASIKHCVRALRARWPRITTRLQESKARKIVNACAVLHNIAQMCNAPIPEANLVKQERIDALLDDHQESAVVSLVTAPDRERLLKEWRVGVVARDGLVQCLKSQSGNHRPNIYRQNEEISKDTEMEIIELDP